MNSSSSNNKRTEAVRHDASPPPHSKKTKSTKPGDDHDGAGITTTTTTSTSSSTNVGNTAGSGSGRNTNAQYVSKISREALERMAMSVLKNGVDKEAISLLEEEQEKANKKIIDDDEQLLSKSEALEKFVESVSILKKQQENADKKKEQQISLIPKLPKSDLADIVEAFHKNEMDKAKSKLNKSFDNQEIRDGVLENKDFMINILSFVGPGHYIYVAGVSKKIQQY